VPPFLGAATAVVIFLLGSRLYNWKAGLLSGVFASVSSFLLIRTMKGFTFHDALSLFLITLTIFLVVKALDILQNLLPAKKKEKIIYLFWILMPAIFVGLTGFSWGGYFVIHAILILYGLLITLHYFATKKALYPLSFLGFDHNYANFGNNSFKYTVSCEELGRNYKSNADDGICIETNRLYVHRRSPTTWFPGFRDVFRKISDIGNYNINIRSL
jgi:hypothetical protein